MPDVVHPNMSNPGSPAAKVATEVAKVLPRDSELVTLEQQASVVKLVKEFQFQFTPDELASLSLARSNFDTVGVQLEKVRASLSEAQELSSSSQQKFDAMTSSQAAAIFLGEPTLAPTDAEVTDGRKARAARGVLANAALGGLHARVKAASEEYGIAASQVRAALVIALKAVIKRQAAAYCQEARKLESSILELLTLDGILMGFTGNSFVDPAGHISLQGKLFAPPLECRPREVRVSIGNAREHVLDCQSGEAFNQRARLLEAITKHLNKVGSMSIATQAKEYSFRVPERYGE